MGIFQGEFMKRTSLTVYELVTLMRQADFKRMSDPHDFFYDYEIPDGNTYHTIKGWLSTFAERRRFEIIDAEINRREGTFNHVEMRRALRIGHRRVRRRLADFEAKHKIVVENSSEVLTRVMSL